MPRVSIIGLGFVGSAMFNSFKKKGVNLTGYDRYKDGGIGSFDDCLDTDICFLALPTIYSEVTKEYNKSPLRETLKLLSEKKYEGIIIIKSTVEPDTTKNLSLEFPNIKLMHNPEFLTARTAEEDFTNQTHIVLGKTDSITDEDMSVIKNLYEKYYPQAQISECSSTESESMKIFCNSFYSVKIQFFNELYLLCQKIGTDYDKVKTLMLKNKWINHMHTDVPGPDGKLSYGGACFPKDTNALLQCMEKYDSSCEILKACIEERNKMRNDHMNCE